MGRIAFWTCEINLFILSFIVDQMCLSFISGLIITKASPISNFRLDSDQSAKFLVHMADYKNQFGLWLMIHQTSVELNGPIKVSVISILKQAYTWIATL